MHSRWTDKAYWRQVRYWIATDAKGVKPGRFKVISPFAYIEKGQ